ncbi:MAG: topoisomerase C-terminal repeat-containing protein [Draconibacterium sp.]
METICKCAICEKGNVIDTGSVFTCDYVKSLEDKCNFTVYKEFMGITITPEILKTLLEDGITETYSLTKLNGDTFQAKLKLNPEAKSFISLDFTPEAFGSPCPKCGRDLNITPNGYSCQGYKDEENPCKFFIHKEIMGVEISEDEVRNIIENGTSSEYFEFEGKKPFAAKLILNDTKEVTFDSKLCKCPKCSDGSVIAVGKVYMCDNQSCNFHIFRNYRFKDITIPMMKKLLSGEAVQVKGISKKDKSGKYDATIKLSESFEVVQL